jgi:hypothetical protein
MADAEDELALREDLRFTVLSVVLGVTMLVLTAVSWSQEDGESYTLWGRFGFGWLSALTLAVLVVMGVVAIAVGVDRFASRGRQLVIVFGALLAAAGAVVVPIDWPGSHTAPARWLCVVAALALAGVHGDRFEQLGRRIPG